MADHESSTPAHAAHSSALIPTALGAIGVVFGDIGTSPLYTLQVAGDAQPGVPLDRADIFGVISLIIWALILAVSVKYVTFVMRADNRGEGGILALLALLPKRTAAGVGAVALLVIAGAALLFGDGMITPAISVLSALEGLELTAPTFKPWVVPLTCVVLVGLFSIQRRGTGSVGKIFGPIMVVWFLTIGLLGLKEVLVDPQICGALSPQWGALYFAHHGVRGLAILGVVVLAITGGEALYADMGHFGPVPIRRAWFFVVFPALVLCYMGQGALVLANPNDDAVLGNPFFAMAPGHGAALALVVLATFATVIASQALISGVFSLTQQAISLGLFPRVTVTHTAAEAEGQIYVPELNALLAVACITLVLVFRESSKLANAFGLAVSGTMLATAIAYYAVARRTWGWPRSRALAVLILFLGFDIPFVTANSMKFFEGGFVPVAVGSAFFAVMVIWRRGRFILGEHLRARAMPIADFHRLLHESDISRPTGGSIFLTGNNRDIPPVVALNVKRLRSLQQNLMLLTVQFEHVPYVAAADRGSATSESDGLYRVVLRYGYMDKPNIPETLAPVVEANHLPFDLASVTYLLGRETIVGGPGGLMSVPVERVFAFLMRNAKSVAAYFQLPHEQVVEIGIQVDL